MKADSLSFKLCPGQVPGMLHRLPGELCLWLCTVLHKNLTIKFTTVSRTTPSLRHQNHTIRLPTQNTASMHEVQPIQFQDLIWWRINPGQVLSTAIGRKSIDCNREEIEHPLIFIQLCVRLLICPKTSTIEFVQDFSLLTQTKKRLLNFFCTLRPAAYNTHASTWL